MDEQIREQRACLEMELIDSFESGHDASAYLAHALKAHSFGDTHGISAEERADCLRFAHRASRLALALLEAELETLGAGAYDSGRAAPIPQADN